MKAAVSIEFQKTDRIHEEMLDRFMRIKKALSVAPVRKHGTSGEIASSATTTPRSSEGAYPPNGTYAWEWIADESYCHFGRL